jgi:hypothetical protein
MLLRFVGAEIFVLIGSTTVQRWFVRLRGRATAVLSSSGIVLLIIPPVLTAIIERLGWRGAYQALAACSVVLLALVAAIIRHDPASEGLRPDGDAEVTDSKPGADELAAPLPVATLGEAARLPLFWALILSSVWQSVFWASFNYHFLSVASSLSPQLGALSPLQLTRAFFLPLALATSAAEMCFGALVLDRVPARRRGALIEQRRKRAR